MESTESSLFSISDEPETVNAFTTILYNKEIFIEPENNTDISSNKPKSNRLCFNCGKDDHCIRECPKPHNQMRIQRNRSVFAGNRVSKAMEFTRYHKEIGDRFSEFRPGKVSSKLREALGLKRDTLPGYIYNMRRLGYPPGWLEEAKISHSGINMLDSNGERVPDPDEEEGEICSVKVKYDTSKIIDYPGFNVWPDPGTINETEAYGSMPMCYDQSKENFIWMLNNSESKDGQEPIINILDSPELRPSNAHGRMEVIDLDPEIKFDEGRKPVRFVPPLPEDLSPPPPPPEDSPSTAGATPDKEFKSNLRDSIISSSSTDVEIIEQDVSVQEISSEEEEGELPSKTLPKSSRQKCATKRNSTSDTDKSTTDTEVKRQKIAADVFPSGHSPVEKDSKAKTVSPSGTPSAEIDHKENTFGRIKSVELGTPVLSHSPYTSLPSPEKFRKDITDVIYFENLPNSTGKYERLKGVLKNVRAKMSKLRGVDVKK